MTLSNRLALATDLGSIFHLSHEIPSPLISIQNTPAEADTKTHFRRGYYGRFGALVESARTLMDNSTAEVHCIYPCSLDLTRTSRLQLSSTMDLKSPTDPRYPFLKDALLFQKKLNEVICHAGEEAPFVHSGKIKHITPSATSLGNLQQTEELSSLTDYLSPLELRAQTLFKERTPLLCQKEEGGFMKPSSAFLLSSYLQHTFPTRFHLHQSPLSLITVHPSAKKYRVSFGLNDGRNFPLIFDSLIATTCQKAPLKIQLQKWQMTPLWNARPSLEAYSLWITSVERSKLEKRFNADLKTENQINQAIGRVLPWKTDLGLMATPLNWCATEDHLHITTHVSHPVTQECSEKTQKCIQTYFDTFVIGQSELSGTIGLTIYDTTPSSALPELLRPVWMNWGPLETSLAGARVIQ